MARKQNRLLRLLDRTRPAATAEYDPDLPNTLLSIDKSFEDRYRTLINREQDIRDSKGKNVWLLCCCHKHSCPYSIFPVSAKETSLEYYTLAMSLCFTGKTQRG
jgi:hypothetical protein